MHYDYISVFPIPIKSLPSKLQSLLEPVSLSPNQFIEVASMQESAPNGLREEHCQLLMAVVPGDDYSPIPVLDEASDGLVESSVPAGGFGCCSNFLPSISGYDYIVAAWGDSSFYTFNLAEKVWMTLGLTPRCLGNEQQRLVYDDLGLPEFGIVEGEVASTYHWSLQKNVSWLISNEYLRRYLWLRGSRGVRVFYYSVQLEDIPVIRALMGGKPHVMLTPDDGTEWYELDIREHEGGLLLQLWASVVAVLPELCPEQSANGLIWPGHDKPMTHAIANNILLHHDPVYIDDKFLQKYEQNHFYNTIPFQSFGKWSCSPSYAGQWSFTQCHRVGRNLLEVPLRELYKAKPDREILHAYKFAIHPNELAHIEMAEEHIVSKVQRLVDVLLRLGNALASLGTFIGLNKTAIELTGFDPVELKNNGWTAYPILCRLAQVAPLEMSQQSFLARCKGLHEIWQRIPNGYLKSILESAGCPRGAIKGLGSLKLLQALLNVVEGLNAQDEHLDAFISTTEPEAWNNNNQAMAALFLNNDLRIADAHEAVTECLATLQHLGFDTANVNSGYGRALDFVFDGVIQSLETIASSIDRLLS